MNILPLKYLHLHLFILTQNFKLKFNQELEKLQQQNQELKQENEEIHQSKQAIEKTLQDYLTTMNELADQVKRFQQENEILIIENEGYNQKLEVEIEKNENLTSECSVLRRVIY